MKARPRRALRPLLVAALLAVPVAAAAWPAIQDEVGGVYLCDTRPSQLADGRWTCRSAGGTYAGALLEVVRPGTPPGVRPWDVPPGAPYRYVPYPWGPPPREPSGYDALDPWLGGRGSAEARGRRRAGRAGGRPGRGRPGAGRALRGLPVGAPRAERARSGVLPLPARRDGPGVPPLPPTPAPCVPRLRGDQAVTSMPLVHAVGPHGMEVRA